MIHSEERQSGSQKLKCRSDNHDLRKLGLVINVTKWTKSHVRIDVFKHGEQESIAHIKIQFFNPDSNDALKLNVGLRYIKKQPLEKDALISYIIVKVTDKRWRRMKISQYLFLKAIETMRLKGVKYFWFTNRADELTNEAPQGFNPWIRPLEDCFDADQIIQLEPEDLWREVLVNLEGSFK